MTVSPELDDAARIDGCGWFSIYWRIVMPLCIPALASVAIFSFLGSWNDFLTPLIYLNSTERHTLALGLTRINVGTSITPLWSVTMAAATLTMIPPLLIFFFAQRYFIQGIVVSGLKG